MFYSKNYNYKNSGIFYEDTQNDMKLPIMISHTYYSRDIFPIVYSDRHWHNTLEIIYVLHAQAIVTINNRTYEINKNNFILINSKDIHKSHVGGMDDFYDGYCFQIDTSFLQKYYPNIHEITFENIYDHNEEIIELLNKLISAYTIEKDTLKIYGYLYLLFSIFSKTATTKSSQNILSDNKLFNILEYIDNNYKKNINPHDIANKFHISYGYLAKLFKETLQTTCKNYINEKRTIKSLEDLLYSSKNITEIALEYGFPNTKSYIENFKKIYNTTPNVYRKDIKS